MTNLQKYQALENKISNSNETYFVVRDTDHPAEDLVRGWSAEIGGISLEGCYAFETLESAIEADKEYHQTESQQKEWRFHPAYKGFCPVHYEGLGAFQLYAENVKDAIKEANEYSAENDLVLTSESGDGCFMSYQVVSFHKVRDGRYIFELK